MGSSQLPGLDAEEHEITEEQLDVDLSGQDLGRYQILERIGQGSMCSVYKAYQAGLGRYVAIKVLPTRFSGDALLTARFLREAQSIAQLKHPNILQVYDIGQEGELPYIVMQYVEGGTLKSLVGQPLSLHQTVEIIDQIAAALEEAHRQGIIHRDVKPSNVLMARPDWFLLSDFGLARVIKASARLTDSGMTVGTPAYMSPEQGRGEKVDGRSDIYGLGVVLFEMLTGTLPYEDSTPMSVIIKHITAPIPHPSTFNPDIAEPIERVVMKALAKDVTDRYGSAPELASALKQAVVSVSSSHVRVSEKPSSPPDESRSSTEEAVESPDRSLSGSEKVLQSPDVSPSDSEKVAQRSDSDGARPQPARRYLWLAGLLALVALIVAIGLSSGLFGIGRAPAASEKGEQDLPSGVAASPEQALASGPSRTLVQTATLTSIPLAVSATTEVSVPIAMATPTPTERASRAHLSTSDPMMIGTDTPAPPAATATAMSPTPNWPATITTQAESLAMAVAKTLTAQPTSTASFTATRTPTDTPVPTSTATATATDTPVPPTATDTSMPPTPDWPATVTAQAQTLAIAVAETLTAQPTSTASFTATRTPTDTPIPTSTATATATDTPVPPTATDTSMPPTPDWPATVTAQAETLAIAVAETLTAQPTPTTAFTATGTPTDTPLPTNTATATLAWPAATDTSMPPTPDWPATVTAQAETLATAIAVVLTVQSMPTMTDTLTPVPTHTPTNTATALPTETVTPTRVPATPTATDAVVSSSPVAAATGEKTGIDTGGPGVTSTPDSTLKGSPTSVAVSTEEAELYPAPDLVNPGHGFTTGDGQTSFEWAWSRELGPDECFELIMSGSLDGPFWGAAACMKEKEITFNVLQASHIKPGPAGQYFWTVKVNRQQPGDQWSTVSATAEPQEIKVSAGGGGGGGGGSSGGGSSPPPP